VSSTHILILRQNPGQLLPSWSRLGIVKRSQLGPRKNNAVAIDDQDLSAHLGRTYAVNEA
jgi:hypothetical protein